MDTGLPGEGQVDYAYDVNPSGNNTPLLTTVAATSGGSPLWTSTLSTDPAGNITTDGASTYTYNLRNLLGDRQLPAATSQHTFDAAGRRVETTRSNTGMTTELVLGPAGERLAKLEDTTWRDYVWLGNRLIAYFHQGDTDPTLVFTNHIGMPLLATDGAGAPIWEAKAEPYGQLRGAVNKTHDPALRYPGQWQDDLDLEATCAGDDCALPGPLDRSFSLFENGYRWYRPDWGRYTQADPLGQDPRWLANLRQGKYTPESLFAYAGGNPARSIDPFGLCKNCDECPSGVWRFENKFWAWNIDAWIAVPFIGGSGITETKGWYICKDNGRRIPTTVSCEPTHGIGFDIGWNPLGGWPWKAATACNSRDLFTTINGSYSSAAIASLLATKPSQQSDWSEHFSYSIGAGISLGAGWVEVSCVVSPR